MERCGLLNSMPHGTLVYYLCNVCFVINMILRCLYTSWRAFFLGTDMLGVCHLREEGLVFSSVWVKFHFIYFYTTISSIIIILYLNETGVVIV